MIPSKISTLIKQNAETFYEVWNKKKEKQYMHKNLFEIPVEIQIQISKCALY